MERLLISQNKHWSKSYKNLYHRDILDVLLNRIELKQIELLQGIRRSGKSTIFKLLINEFSKKNSLYQFR